MVSGAISGAVGNAAGGARKDAGSRKEAGSHAGVGHKESSSGTALSQEDLTVVVLAVVAVLVILWAIYRF